MIPIRSSLIPRWRSVFFISTGLAALLGVLACGDDSTPRLSSSSIIRPIANIDEYSRIVSSAGDQLLLIDLYADWCPPCRNLMPVLEEIARENRERVTVYKIDIDANQDLARSFGVTGIPFVVLVKNQKTLHSLRGLRPKDHYLSAIDRFAEKL